MSKRPSSSTEGQGQQKRHHGELSAKPLLIPGLSAITPWSYSEISSELPSLPLILDPELELSVFNHPGIGYGSNYERLEWLGDAYIEMIATALIFQTFGDATAGRGSQLREQLVRNITLADYFRQYKLERKARLPADMGILEQLVIARPRDKELIKIQGDMFEAFVAAVVVSDPVNGLSTVVTWLKSLWGRTIKDQIKKAEAERKSAPKHGSMQPAAPEEVGAKDARPKELLAKKMLVKGIRLRYEDMSNNNKKDKHLGLPLFTVGVYLDGWGETNKFLGVGTALQKKEAGQKAATMALENKKLMKLFEERKKTFQETERAKGDQAPK
ncbi:hypothetical protein AK830_g11640 [Neonectria ditissima]|uniref:RNase III domain-containing protein n=1 Tax=Neonectria ditissima TaxID=78410 RepID=A0A0N8H519_9HYPO|nr:hypothetical protein AK830_g11640 [Neonectria ditissima]